MGPIWGRQDPGGPHVGLMNFATLEVSHYFFLFPFKFVRYGVFSRANVLRLLSVKCIENVICTFAQQDFYTAFYNIYDICTHQWYDITTIFFTLLLYTYEKLKISWRMMITWIYFLDIKHLKTHNTLRSLSLCNWYCARFHLCGVIPQMLTDTKLLLLHLSQYNAGYMIFWYSNFN